MTTLIPIEHPTRNRHGVIVRRGPALGEASPLAGRSHESFEDALQALALGGAAPPSVDFARFGLEATRGTTSIRSQVLLESAESAVSVLRSALLRGDRAFKLKIRARADADVLLELRTLAPSILLRVDANRAFAHERDVPWDVLARAGVEWIEEPCVNAGSLAGTPVPIALDESVLDDPARALEDLGDGRASALVLKPTILGASATLELGHACQRLGGRAIISHAFESEIGRLACEEIARRVDPAETHGLARWDGIDDYRVVASRLGVRSLIESFDVHSVLG